MVTKSRLGGQQTRKNFSGTTREARMINDMTVGVEGHTYALPYSSAEKNV
jgi:hypothetical protein